MTASLAYVEQRYAGRWGDAYTNRHLAAPVRDAFWRRIVGRTTPASALEVGCNVGHNLSTLQRYAVRRLVGVDINQRALAACPAGVQTARASVAALPFASHSFDLVFTAGTLIHVPADALPLAFDELVRVSRRYVLTVEYEDPAEREIVWRGERGLLWSRPHSFLLWQRHGELVPVDRGTVGKRDGFDRGMAWGLWEVPGA